MMHRLATMHSVTDKQTDRQTDNTTMTTGDPCSSTIG